MAAPQEHDKSQKTERPTGRRIEKAYEKGSVPRAQDVGPAVALAVFLGWATLGGAGFMTTLSGWMRHALATVARAERAETHLERLVEAAVVAARLLVVPVGLLLVFAVVQSLAQTGFHPRKPPVPFDLERLDPVKGLKKFVSVEKAVHALRAIARVALYAVVVGVVLVPRWPRIVALTELTPMAIGVTAARLAGAVLLWALLVAAALAVVDYAFTRYRWYRNLYMTKKEVKDEQKENEGSPEVKQKIRQRQREVFRRRMMTAVPTADVVVTNPTHVAVALRYERDRMAAPTLVAKGRGHIARRIREIAREHGVPIVEDPPLARLLERVCRVGEEIPEVLYRAVAEVFAYVFGRRRGAYRPLDQTAELEREAGRPRRAGRSRP